MFYNFFVNLKAMARSEQHSATSSESFFAKTILLFVLGNILPAAKDPQHQQSTNSTDSTSNTTKQSAKLRRRAPTNKTQVLTVVAILTILLVIAPTKAANCDGVGYPADDVSGSALQPPGSDCLCTPDVSTAYIFVLPDENTGDLHCFYGC